MAYLEPWDVVDGGNYPTYSPASLSDTVLAETGKDVLVLYWNADSADKTIQIPMMGETSYGLPLPSPEFTIAAGEQIWIPIRKEYISLPGGLVEIRIKSPGTATGLTVSVARTNTASVSDLLNTLGFILDESGPILR